MSLATPQRSKDIADILDGAWDILDSEGWARGAEATANVHRPSGPCCLGVAICRSARERNLGRALRPALQAVSRHINESIPVWNDRQSSPIRVMRTLERVADAHRLRAEGVSR